MILSLRPPIHTQYIEGKKEPLPEWQGERSIIAMTILQILTTHNHHLPF